MKATSSEITKYITVLSETPVYIAQMATGFGEVLLQHKPEEKSWSANDILAHIRSCADLWTHSIYAMLAEMEPEFSDINERKWTKVTQYIQRRFRESLKVFSLQRENLILVLKDLPFDAWERSATIAGRKHTVFTQTRRMARHEMEHLEQFARLLSRISDKR